MRQPWNYKRFCFLIIALALLPQMVQAGVEWKTLQKVKLENRALDVTASFDGSLIFSLTPGAILVYATADNRFIDRIPVDASYTRIAYSNDERLILSAADPAAFNIIKFNRVYDINIVNRPFKGAADAKVTLVVFDDYQWPYCARLEALLQQVLERYPQDVKIVVKQFPLKSHRFAFPASMGAMAAKNQGKFWEFHGALMENYNALNDAKILSIAKDLGLDMARYNGDSKSPGNRALILEDISDGNKIKVRGTPSVYVNGKSVKGRRIGNLLSIVADELALLKKSSQKK